MPSPDPHRPPATGLGGVGRDERPFAGELRGAPAGDEQQTRDGEQHEERGEPDPAVAPARHAEPDEHGAEHEQGGARGEHGRTALEQVGAGGEPAEAGRDERPAGGGGGEGGSWATATGPHGRAGLGGGGGP
jgi:hypothetical protein